MSASTESVFMPVYHTNFGSVETLEWGAGDTVIVLLHAAAAGPGALAGLARRLEAQGRRVVTAALHGYERSEVARLGALLPGSRVVTLPGCGHMGPLTEPKFVAAALCAAWDLA